MKKRILAIALVALLIASVVPMAVSAAGTMSISAGTVEATLKAGDTVKVPVSFTENSGYGYGYVVAGWDSSALVLTDVEYTALAPKQSSAAPVENDGSYKVSFGDMMTTTPFTGTGEAFNLVFTISETATAGDYTITLSNDEVYDPDIDTVTTSATGGTVTLKTDAPEPPATAKLSMEAGTCTTDLVAGDTVTVPVNFTENSGYGYGYVTASWDKDALELTNVTYTSLAPKQSSAAPIENDGTYKVSFGDMMATAPFEGTGEAFSLVFTITSAATAGDYTIGLSDTEVYTTEIVTMDSEAASGKVTLNAGETPHSHTLTKHDEVPAECEKDGTKAYWSCECGKLFSDAEGNHEISAPEIIPATNHDWDEGTVTTPATCTTAGVITYKCKNNPTHTYNDTISAKGHTNMTHVEYKAPTATEDGNKEYYICNDCHKWFWDATGNALITDHSEVIIPATGVEPTTAAPEPVEETTVAPEPTTVEPVVEPTTVEPVVEPTTVEPVEETTVAPEETTAETVEPTTKAATPDSPATGDTPGGKPGADNGTPKTGDTGMLALWITLMLAGIAGMATTVVVTKVKKK